MPLEAVQAELRRRRLDYWHCGRFTLWDGWLKAAADNSQNADHFPAPGERLGLSYSVASIRLVYPVESANVFTSFQRQQFLVPHFFIVCHPPNSGMGSRRREATYCTHSVGTCRLKFQQAGVCIYIHSSIRNATVETGFWFIFIVHWIPNFARYCKIAF